MSWLQAGCCTRHESPAMGRDARGYDSKARHAQPGRQRPRTGAELSRDNVSATCADGRLAKSISQTLTRRLALGAAELRLFSERLPEQMIFGRGGEDWIALATKAAIEFSLGKQGAQFGFA